jgi:hypothetical protein
MKHLDYTTEVLWQDGLLEVTAQVTISGDGDYYLDWWAVEGHMQPRMVCPDKMEELLFDLAEDNMKEDL